MDTNKDFFEQVVKKYGHDRIYEFKHALENPDISFSYEETCDIGALLVHGQYCFALKMKDLMEKINKEPWDDAFLITYYDVFRLHGRAVTCRILDRNIGSTMSADKIADLRIFSKVLDTLSKEEWEEINKIMKEFESSEVGKKEYEMRNKLDLAMYDLHRRKMIGVIEKAFNV